MVFGPFPPSARVARAAYRQWLRIIQLGASPAHGVRRDTDRVGDDPHSTRTQLAGLAAQPHPALTLGQVRLDRVVATDQGLGHHGHSTNRSHPRPETRLFRYESLGTPSRPVIYTISGDGTRANNSSCSSISAVWVGCWCGNGRCRLGGVV